LVALFRVIIPNKSYNYDTIKITIKITAKVKDSFDHAAKKSGKGDFVCLLAGEGSKYF